MQGTCDYVVAGLEGKQKHQHVVALRSTIISGRGSVVMKEAAIPLKPAIACKEKNRVFVATKTFNPVGVALVSKYAQGGALFMSSVLFRYAALKIVNLITPVYSLHGFDDAVLFSGSVVNVESQ